MEVEGLAGRGRGGFGRTARRTLASVTACVLFLLPGCLPGAGVVGAQSSDPGANPAPSAGTTTPADPAHGDSMQLSPMAALRAFEPAADQPYELGRGDDISIDFTGRPELNAKRTIGPDGRISLPLVGALDLADKTREQAADTIAKAFAPYYERLTITVGVDKYTSNRVLLLGAVQSPGVITFDRQPTLLEVLTRAGGLRNTTSSDPTASTGGVGAAGSPSLARSSAVVPQRLAIYRGTDQVLWVDLKGLLDNGSPLADLRLKRDDVVYVPSPLERYISILGQVSHPGAFLLDNNTTLAKLMAEAGGPTQLAGSNPKLQIIQPETGQTRVIDLKTMLKPNALDLTLRSGDIIFVPESGFNKVAYTMNQLSPLLTLVTVATLFAQR